MNKADKIFILLVVFIAFGLYLPSLWKQMLTQNSEKEVVVN